MYMVLLLFNFYLFRPLSMTLSIFQDHSNIKEFNWKVFVHIRLSSGNCQETEICMVCACHTPWQPPKNHPSQHLGGWAKLWSAEEMLDGQHLRLDIPSVLCRVSILCPISVLTLIRCPFHPRVTAVARKRPRSFCQKCRWQVTPKTLLRPSLNEVGLGWLCRCPGIVWEPIRKQAHTQLVREHSVTVVSARWDVMDRFWPKEWYKCARANLHIKKKAQVGKELSSTLPKSSHAR